MQHQLIAGRYQISRAIGHGGMGTVWLCRDEVLGREVAVKQIGALPGESATCGDVLATRPLLLESGPFMGERRGQGLDGFGDRVRMVSGRWERGPTHRPPSRS